MPLPQGFSEWEHLQSTLVRVHNAIVREEFSEITDDDDISVPRGSLKVASLIKDDDSANMVISRLWLFYVMCRKAADFHEPIYGIPASEYHETVTIRPQVKLFFQQDWSAVPTNRKPTRAKISFRLINETAASLHPTEANQLALKIKNEFALSGGYRFTKGKNFYYYREPSKGYDLRILASSKSEAQELFRKVLDLKNNAPNWDYLTTSDPERSFPTNPGTELIYGKQRPKPVKRPTATVRFTHALLYVPGLINPVVLCDRTGTYRNPLQTA